MKCPLCTHPETKVVETRESTDSTRRRRECLNCNDRFTTYERADQELIIIKKDNSKEKFCDEKLLKGVQRACEKRPVSEQQITELVKSVEQQLRENHKEVDSKQVGELVMQKLAELDDVAYIRFASVYREFEDPTLFAQEVKKLKELKKEGIVKCRL